MQRKNFFNQNQVWQQHKKLVPFAKYMTQSCKKIIAEARYTDRALNLPSGKNRALKKKDLVSTYWRQYFFCTKWTNNKWADKFVLKTSVIKNFFTAKLFDLEQILRILVILFFKSETEFVVFEFLELFWLITVKTKMALIVTREYQK